VNDERCECLFRIEMGLSERVDGVEMEMKMGMVEVGVEWRPWGCGVVGLG
jgi:hypothetical protein